MSAAVTMYYTASSACMIWAYKLKPLFPSLHHLHPPQLLLLHLDRMNGLVLLTVRALTPKMVLAPRYDGPYQVLDFVSPVICKIRHTHSKKERTVHVGELKQNPNEQTADTLDD